MAKGINQLGFAVQVMPSALDELKDIKVYGRQKIAHAIEEQLSHQPTVATRNRKVLSVSQASFAFEPPLWELRVEHFRVFYDVEEECRTVYVRAIRDKPPHASSEEIL